MPRSQAPPVTHNSGGGLAVKHRRFTLTAIAVLLTLLLTSSPASAEAVSGRDPRGDAIASVDVTRYAYVNGQHVVSIRASIRDPQPRHSTFYAFYDPGHRGGKELYYSLTQPRRSGGFRTTLYKLHVRVSQTVVRCPGLAVRWTTGSGSGVRVRIPRSCLGDTPGPAYFRGNVQHIGGSYSTDGLPRRRLSRR